MSAANSQIGKLEIITPPVENLNRASLWNEKILDAIDTNTAAVAISHAHWADGTKFDLEEIRNRTRDVGSLLIIDGTQSVGAMPFDIERIQPDALICAGYKWLLGPYGLGLAYFAETFDDGIPIEENWINRLNSENFAGLVDYEEEYQPGALRYGMGEQSQFVLAPMLLEALRQINAWNPERIQEYCATIISEPIGKLRNHGYWIEDENFRSSHLFGIRHETIPIESVKKQLSSANIFVSYRGTAVRVSPFVHNTKEQVEFLVDELIKIT
jgi:selenocysteine lyase/cysteine desulfurase